MENKGIKWPVYLKLSNIILGILALFFILYIGKDIIIPIIFSIIIAILLNPFVNFLCRKRMNRVVAIMIAVVAAIVFIIALAYFIFSQAVMLSDSLPHLKEKFSAFSNQCISWVTNHFNINKYKINTWLTKTRSEGMENSTAVIGSALSYLTGILVLLFLIPVYIFMILFYKPLLLEFISKLFKSEKQEIVTEVLGQTKILIQSYLVGLLIEAAIVATLNSVGLLILGIKYAVLIGVIGALLNMIPYIGGLVAISIPMFIALATKTPLDAFWVLILYLFVQLVDNNFIVPKIVASKVKINALISIIVVLIGGALWGVAGMFLAIPITAIIKVICDRIDVLNAFGFLIGDNQPEIAKAFFKPKILEKLKSEVLEK